MEKRGFSLDSCATLGGWFVLFLVLKGGFDLRGGKVIFAYRLARKHTEKNKNCPTCNPPFPHQIDIIIQKKFWLFSVASAQKLIVIEFPIVAISVPSLLLVPYLKVAHHGSCNYFILFLMYPLSIPATWTDRFSHYYLLLFHPLLINAIITPLAKASNV
ncbi:hypothetical protein BJV82DRAFT_604058 [Fennellomyces sp. T-0311]|nr:hypothetical protein BJV82DRAFT_604058 [Fennellomyces sp. T-0311]